MGKLIPVRKIIWAGVNKPTKAQSVAHYLDRMVARLEELEGLNSVASRAIWLDRLKRRLGVELGLGSGRETKHGFRFTSLDKGHGEQVARLIDAAKAGDAYADWLLCSTVADLLDAGALSCTNAGASAAASLLAYEGLGKRLRALPLRTQGPRHRLRNGVFLTTIEQLCRLGFEPTRNAASRERVGSAAGRRRSGPRESACSLIAEALAKAHNAGKAVPLLDERTIEKIWENRFDRPANGRRKAVSET